MADLLRHGGHGGHGPMSILRDRMNSPSSGSDDDDGGGGVGAIDLAELSHELDQDEFDGPAMIGGKQQQNVIFFSSLEIIVGCFLHLHSCACGQRICECA